MSEGNGSKGLRGLSVVRLSKTELVSALEKNKEQHKTLCEQAMGGYWTAVEKALRRRIKELEEALQDVVDRKHTHHSLHGLSKPEDHTEDYDRVLRLLAMSLDDQFELTLDEFRQYVMDDWGWKERFATTASMYSS